MTVVPTLSDRGWIKNPPEKLDFLFAHYLESEGSGNIQTEIMRNGSDISTLIQRMQMNMRDYLSRYYPSVQLNITVDTATNQDSSAVGLVIDCDVTDENGISFSAGYILQSKNTMFSIVASKNNYGI